MANNVGTGSISLDIGSFFGNYTIEISKFANFPNYNLVIVDQVVHDLYPSEFVFDNVVKFPTSEESKNISSVVRVLELFQEHSITRSSVVAFVGGGVLQDVATLACSLYKRGIKWVFYPTTLQAMIDSCVGGKSSINFNSQKNLLGNFFPPNSIKISTNYLNTQSHDALASGLLEGLKISLAAEKDLEFLQLCSNFTEIRMAELDFKRIIAFCLRAKKHFVEIDEFDRGVRRLLNFGHTFGHAIESSSNYRISHGFAVGLGMLAAFNLARRLNIYDREISNSEHGIEKLLEFISDESRDVVRNLDLEAFIDSLRFDKKSLDGAYVFILPSNSGLLEVPLPITEENDLLILSSMRHSLLQVS